METLPTDLICEILIKSSVAELWKIYKCNKQFREICRSDRFWNLKIDYDFDIPIDLINNLPQHGFQRYVYVKPILLSKNQINYLLSLIKPNLTSSINYEYLLYDIKNKLKKIPVSSIYLKRFKDDLIQYVKNEEQQYDKLDLIRKRVLDIGQQLELLRRKLRKLEKAKAKQKQSASSSCILV